VDFVVRRSLPIERRLTDLMAATNITDLGSVSNVTEFLEKVSPLTPRYPCPWLFRGHRESDWPLIPQLDREEYVAFRDAKKQNRDWHERWLLKEFQKAARPHLASQPGSVWEWLAVAQHHGLATRLLDWSFNPLVGLFFAVEGRWWKKKSVVWCYQHVGKSSVSWPDPLDPALTDIITFSPPHLSARIPNQQALFTVHPFEGDPVGSQWQGEVQHLQIPGDHRDAIRAELDTLGIHRGLLFPDLDGVSRWLNTNLTLDPP
jgi:hypothetical protein